MGHRDTHRPGGNAMDSMITTTNIGRRRSEELRGTGGVLLTLPQLAATAATRLTADIALCDRWSDFSWAVARTTERRRKGPQH